MNTKVTTDDLDQILMEGARRDGDWFRTATTDLDDYEKLRDDLYYDRDDDEYILVTSFSDMDEFIDRYMEESPETVSEYKERGEDLQAELEADYADGYREEYNISNDYTDYEVVRRHICSTNGFSRDFYTNYGVGRIYLRRG